MELQTQFGPEPPQVLLADDQRNTIDALELLLKSEGYRIESASRPSEILAAVESRRFDVVLMDLNYTRDTTSGGEGLEVLSSIQQKDRTLPLLVMTAWGSVDLAVEAMRRGASDFIQKPWENEQLLSKLKYQIQKRRAQSKADREYEFELQEAREMQRKLFPTKIPQVSGYEIAGSSYPVRFVGGDYFDVAEIGPNRTAICIADVVGKGLPAALLLSSLHAALAPLMAEGVPPRDLCRRLNRILCGITPVGKFISFFYGVLDSRQNKLVYCNAGHNPPALVRGTQAHRLCAGGTVLGLFGEADYEQQEVQLRRGDALLLYTDGVSEAQSAADDEFGEERLVKVAMENPALDAGKLQNAIMREVATHCGGNFHDDATLIVLRAKE